MWAGYDIWGERVPAMFPWEFTAFEVNLSLRINVPCSHSGMSEQILSWRRSGVGDWPRVLSWNLEISSLEVQFCHWMFVPRTEWGHRLRLECNFLSPNFEDFPMRLCLSSHCGPHHATLGPCVNSARIFSFVLVVMSRHIVPNVSAPVGLVRYRGRLCLMRLRTCFT